MFWSSVHEAKRVDDCLGEISVLPTMRSRSGKRLQIHLHGRIARWLAQAAPYTGKKCARQSSTATWRIIHESENSQGGLGLVSSPLHPPFRIAGA